MLASVLRQIEAHAEHGWPGNARELEQAIRQVLIKGFYEPLILPKESHSSVDQGMLFDSMGEASAEQCLAAYAQHLHRKHQSLRPLHGFVRRSSNCEKICAASC